MTPPSRPLTDGAFVAQAVERWHELLRGDAGPASAQGLLDGLRATRLTFGDRPICRVLRPYFLAEGEAKRLNGEAEALMSALRKVRRKLETDRAWRSLLRLTEDEELVLAADRQPFEPDQIARLDGFLVRDGAYRVIEYNAESPGGIAFGDTLCSIFRGLPVLQAFAREYALRSVDGLDLTLRQLVAAHRARVGPAASPNPNIAVVDRRSAPTAREFEICAESFTYRGCPSRVVEPDELRFENGRLVAGDFVVDVVYKRVLVGDLIRTYGTLHPLFQALRAGAVTVASGFGVHLLYRKELFAFLHDDRIKAELDARERSAVDRCVPWTRLVADVEVRDGDRAARLLDLVRRRKDRLVLKPTAEYGGKGVTLGWLVDDAAWEKALQDALDEPHVVQERVELGRESFPLMIDGKLTFAPFYADVNPYIWGGVRSEGFGARLASGELLNVTAGGGSAVPVFILDRP
ncbi:MAG TPA: hypothetical protein VEI02_04240 [Planctomycetota bacterium]|nr:hypothetical protein [Planctomycetota bacterium]